MYDKKSRQATIKELVRAGLVQSQEDLQTLLNERGFAATQATLSRDMKALGIVKMHDPKRGYSYRLPFREESPEGATASLRFPEGILSIEFSYNMAVIKTRPGFASVIAALLDASDVQTLMGTLAGDDTVLLVLREGFSRQQVMQSLSAVLPGISELEYKH